tara:strand:- start:2359 stop:2544 length:186 start_codon:yes stop_codon:yes gene_type:complete
MKFVKDSLKLYGDLFRDIFIKSNKESTHGWCRYPLYPKSQYEQNKMLKKIINSIKQKQTIK